MATRTKSAPIKASRPPRAKLTAYESDQVAQIAAWKSRPPNPYAEMYRRTSLPAARLVGKVTPDSLVRTAIDASFDLAERLSGKEDVIRRAGVRDLTDLRRRPLEECDRLAWQTGVSSQVVGTVQGGVTGFGGIFTTLIDVPLLFVFSLRTILKIGHCYGYPLDQPRERHFVLGMLIAALSGTLESRRRRIDELHELEECLVQEAQEEIVAEELISFVFQLEIFAEIPGMGAISGAALNLTFMRRIDNMARRIFQERWLKDNGKVRSIAPASVHSRDLAPGWAGAIRRAVYSGCYTVGFGMALPVSVLASIVGGGDNALMRGARDAASDAASRVDKILGAIEEKPALKAARPRRRPVAALA